MKFDKNYDYRNNLGGLAEKVQGMELINLGAWNLGLLIHKFKALETGKTTKLFESLNYI